MKYKAGDVVIWTLGHHEFKKRPVVIIEVGKRTYTFEGSVVHSSEFTEKNTRKLTKLERALR